MLIVTVCGLPNPSASTKPKLVTSCSEALLSGLVAGLPMNSHHSGRRRGCTDLLQRAYRQEGKQWYRDQSGIRI